MKILSVDTSNISSSVSILENEKNLGEIFLNCGLVHSKTIFRTIKYLIDLMPFDIKDIDLFSVCTGPGSYTGIRIGLSIVKGMQLVSKKPCVGISSLLSLAYSVKNLEESEVVYSCIKANKDEIYFNAYDYKMNEKFNDNFVNLDQLIKIVKSETKKIIFVGNVASECYNRLRNIYEFDAEVYDSDVHAFYIGKASCEMFLKGSFYNDASLIKANYVKDVHYG